MWVVETHNCRHEHVQCDLNLQNQETANTMGQV